MAFRPLTTIGPRRPIYTQGGAHSVVRKAALGGVVNNPPDPDPDPDPDPPPDPLPEPSEDTILRVRFRPGTWSEVQLDNDAPIDPISAQSVSEILRQKARISPTFNVSAWGIERVLAGDVNKPVYMVPRSGNSDLEWILLHHGVPYPDDLYLQQDNDCALLVVRPQDGATATTVGHTELYGCQWRQPGDTAGVTGHRGFALTDDVLWCRHMGQMIKRNGPYNLPGNYVTKSPYRNADGTYPYDYIKKEMGCWGSGIAAEATLVQREELETGVANSPLGLIVFAGVKNSGARRVPATRNDSGCTTLTPYGGILRLPHNWVIDPARAKNRMSRMCEQKARDFGIVMCDAGGSLAFRTTADCQEFFDGFGWGETARMFPWANLQLLDNSWNTRTI